MIVITNTAQHTLNHVISRYIGFRTPQEYGISAFQYWYYQVMNEVNSLDIEHNTYGVAQIYQMQYWGKIKYIQIKTKTDVYTRILEFYFSIPNLIQWITRHELPGTPPSPPTRPPVISSYPQVVHCKGIGKKVQLCRYRDGSYHLSLKGSQIPIPFKFDSFKSPFRKHKDGEYAIFMLDGKEIHLTEQHIQDAINDYISKKQQKLKNENVYHMDKTTIRLTESDLHKVIKESVRQIIYEYKTKRLGKYDVVFGDMTPHKIDGLEQYGKNLYDYRMYHAKDETFCVFKIGKDTRKFICCRLEYDKEYGAWLGFTPIKNYLVPILIKQDLQN